MISDSIDPNLIFNISMNIVNELDKDIIVIKVLKGTKRPYYLKNKGMTSEGVYLRLGATNKQASRDDIVKMMMEDSGIRFEDNISKEQDLTFNALSKEFENQNIKIDKVKMKNMGLLTEQNLYTNLAYIVSDQNTFPIKIAIYKGNNKEEFLDKKDLDNMSIFEQLHEIETFLNLVIKVPAKIIGMKRVESPEYNLEVIRESILNSIIHRDYSVYGSTLINIYENNIEIVNIGGLVGGLTIEAIKKGSSATRNPKLASIFHRLNYVEAYGSGIPRIIAKYKYQEKQPLIETTENSFFITFPKLESIEFNDDIIALNQIYNEKGKIQREDIEKLFNCSKTTAIRKLNKYTEMEILKQISIGNKTYYEMIEK
jgi:ATP-dependent DNA helicase RecG